MKHQSSNWLPLALAEMLKTFLTERFVSIAFLLLPVVFFSDTAAALSPAYMKVIKKAFASAGPRADQL